MASLYTKLLASNLGMTELDLQELYPYLKTKEGKVKEKKTPIYKIGQYLFVNKKKTKLFLIKQVSNYDDSFVYSGIVYCKKGDDEDSYNHEDSFLLEKLNDLIDVVNDKSLIRDFIARHPYTSIFV